MIEYNKLFHQHVQKIILSRSKCPNNSFYLSRKKILLIHSNANISSFYLLFIVYYTLCIVYTRLVHGTRNTTMICHDDRRDTRLVLKNNNK